MTITVLDSNDPPVILAPVPGSIIPFEEESSKIVFKIVAVDEDGTAPIYELSGFGADDSNFTIDASGNLSFLSAPDFEVNGSKDGDNLFRVEVVVKDATDAAIADKLLIDVNVTNVNDNAPVLAGSDPL